MSGEKYIGLDVHQATISVAVMDSQGKLIGNPFWKPKRQPFSSSWQVCVELYR
jgi:hypothetical protein